MTMSLTRPVTRTYPSASITPRSPEVEKPSAVNISAVARLAEEIQRRRYAQSERDDARADRHHITALPYAKPYQEGTGPADTRES
jgi:hypothetical protein